MKNHHPLAHYHYEIGEKNIGKNPANPRDHAKLLVYDTVKDEISIDRFYNLINYLPENALMVMNNTGVIPARVDFVKDTGGRVEGLVLINEGWQEDGTIPVIVNKQIIVGRTLNIAQYGFEVLRQNHQYFYLKPNFDKRLLPSILVEYGTTPTPKYLGKLDMEESVLRERYQTIFSKENKSVAAPTASLHFTERVLTSLKDKNIERVAVTLHVGMGTFAEVTEDNIQSQSLHTEPISISNTAWTQIQNYKNKHKPIIAVGTTAMRTLESQAGMLMSKPSGDIHTATNLFIRSGYSFQIADILITNFHTPRSSLMALVDAFLQHKKSKKDLLSLYDFAIENEFQFFSFGDSMLIL